MLDEDDPEILEAFVYWLYYGQLAGTTVADPSAADFQARASVGLTQMQLVNVWIWGDMRKIPALQNHALKDLDLHYREIGLLDIDIFRRVCTGTPPRSSLRRFAGMLAAGIKNVEKDLEDEMQDPTFLAGMCEVLLKIRNHCPMGVVVEQTTMPVDEFFVEEKQSRSSHVPKESGA